MPRRARGRCVSGRPVRMWDACRNAPSLCAHVACTSPTQRTFPLCACGIHVINSTHLPPMSPVSHLPVVPHLPAVSHLHAVSHLPAVPVGRGDERHLREAAAKHTDGGGAHDLVPEMRGDEMR